MDLASFITKSNLGKNKVFIAWTLSFYDIRVSLYLNPNVLDLENFRQIGEKASATLTRGYSSASIEKYFQLIKRA